MKTLEMSGTVSPADRWRLREIKSIVCSALPEADVLLFGSVARGTQDTASDYDILVLTATPLSRSDQNDIRGMVFDWELGQGIVVSMLFRCRDEWDAPLALASPFRQAIEEDALVL